MSHQKTRFKEFLVENIKNIKSASMLNCIKHRSFKIVLMHKLFIKIFGKYLILTIWRFPWNLFDKLIWQNSLSFLKDSLTLTFSIWDSSADDFSIYRLKKNNLHTMYFDGLKNFVVGSMNADNSINQTFGTVHGTFCSPSNLHQNSSSSHPKQYILVHRTSRIWLLTQKWISTFDRNNLICSKMKLYFHIIFWKSNYSRRL